MYEEVEELLLRFANGFEQQYSTVSDNALEVVVVIHVGTLHRFRQGLTLRLSSLRSLMSCFPASN